MFPTAYGREARARSDSDDDRDFVRWELFFLFFLAGLNPWIDTIIQRFAIEIMVFNVGFPIRLSVVWVLFL